MPQERLATETLERLLQLYAQRRQPIDVSFRELVGPIPADDQTHSVYPYPARLLRQIPRFLLRCQQLVRGDAVVLDPFCGSGTVLVEARAAGLTSWGIDSNPFARLLSGVKTTPLDRADTSAWAQDIVITAKRLRSPTIPPVVSIAHWFSDDVACVLGRLRRALDESGAPTKIQRFLLVALALTAERSSLRDPRIPVPVRRRDWRRFASTQKPARVWDAFVSTAAVVADRVARLSAAPGVSTIIAGEDAAQASSIYRTQLSGHIPTPTVILTSPPYGSAQKYIRSSSLALGWTGLAKPGDLAKLERCTIGREHLLAHERPLLAAPPMLSDEITAIAATDSLRAAIYAHYFRAMDHALADLTSLLASGGVLMLIAGTNVVAGRLLPTHVHLKALAERHGLTHVLELRDTIRGRILLTKRASSATPLHHETVHVLRKA